MTEFKKSKWHVCILAAAAIIVAGCGNQGNLNDTHDPGEHVAHDESGQSQALSGGEINDDSENGHPGEEQAIKLSARDMEEFGIMVNKASGGELSRRINLPGEVKLNEDNLVHVVPRLQGVVRTVKVSLGDKVTSGQVMAVIESWELAEAAAVHVAAATRLSLAEARFERELDLYQQKITSLEDFLAAKQTMIEARIEMEKAEQKHRALDLSESDHKRGDKRFALPSADYSIIAPMAGTVISKHISRGEVMQADTDAFLLADLSTVWVDLSVYQKDIPFVREGENITLSAGHGIPEAEARIDYVGPLVGEATRTLLARVLLDNSAGLWKPGLFVNGRMQAHSRPVNLVVVNDAVQELHGETAVFVQDTQDGSFQVRHVTVGGQDEQWTEITSGLEPGESYVSEGAFLLKSQLLKGAFGHGHVH